MGMRLTAEQLAEIAGKVEELDTLGVEVTQIKMHDHEIYTRQVDGERGGRHVVVGISRPDLPEKQNARDGGRR